jgi:hypothetical protein
VIRYAIIPSARGELQDGRRLAAQRHRARAEHRAASSHVDEIVLRVDEIVLRVDESLLGAADVVQRDPVIVASVVVQDDRGAAALQCGWEQLRNVGDQLDRAAVRGSDDSGAIARGSGEAVNDGR